MVQTMESMLNLETTQTTHNKLLILNFQLSTISSGTTRVLSVPDESGIIATRAWAQTNYESYTQTYVQTSGRNSQGNKTISTSAPTGGSVGDIWYRV